MSICLVKFQADWADEFDCQELVVKSGTVEGISKYIEDTLEKGEDYYFGSNEGFEPDELSLGNFSIEEITELEALFVVTRITKRVNSTFGTGILSNIFDGYAPEYEYEVNK
jgi:hypothetical protein